MTDITELFARDPLKLTKPEVREIVEIYRAKRYQFVLGDKTAGSTKKVAKENGPKLKSLDGIIDIGEI